MPSPGYFITWGRQQRIAKGGCFRYHAHLVMSNEIPEFDYGAPFWHVVHARPRCEKKLAEYFLFHRLEHYLPLRMERKIYQRRKVEVLKPLFPGYVFVSFNQHQRLLVLKSRQVVRILQINDQARFLNEIAQVRQALEVNPVLGACPALARGMRVRIVSGPFQGLQGVVSALKGETRVVLNVDIIGQGVPVEVGPEMLERLL